jgi:hypothetical protein
MPPTPTLQVGEGVGVGLGDEPPPLPPPPLPPPPLPPDGGLELEPEPGALDFGAVGFDLGELGALDFGADGWVERGWDDLGDFGVCEPCPEPGLLPCAPCFDPPEPPTAVGAPGLTAIGLPVVIGGSDPVRMPTGTPVTLRPLR